MMALDSANKTSPIVLELVFRLAELLQKSITSFGKHMASPLRLECMKKFQLRYEFSCFCEGYCRLLTKQSQLRTEASFRTLTLTDGIRLETSYASYSKS